ncbi:MAG TPA: hypothetical protein VGR91_17380 [Stellaceae bacterium]|nr:hypothetical protein [Stellaceae bacterium]
MASFFPALLAVAAADIDCAYILDPDRRTGPQRAVRRCAAPRQEGSSYCPYHHARCHLVPGSPAEAVRLLEIELLAETVGGRCGPKAARPSPRFLDRLEALSRDFS